MLKVLIKYSNEVMTLHTSTNGGGWTDKIGSVCVRGVQGEICFVLPNELPFDSPDTLITIPTVLIAVSFANSQSPLTRPIKPAAINPNPVDTQTGIVINLNCRIQTFNRTSLDNKWKKATCDMPRAFQSVHPSIGGGLKQQPLISID